MKNIFLPISFLVLISLVYLNSLGAQNPMADFYDSYPGWTDDIRWNNVIDMSLYENGDSDFEKFENARDELYDADGGVLFYPAGEYDFASAPVDGPDGRGLMLKKGVVILGEAPAQKTLAKEGNMDLPTIFKFKYIEKEPGKEVPADWNFIGITTDFGEELKDVDNVGIAWVNLVGGTVYFGAQMTWGDRYTSAGAWKSSKIKEAWKNRRPDGKFPFDPFCGAPVNSSLYEGAGSGRFVFGCQFDNSTVINNVIDEGFGEDGYYVYKFGSRIGVYGSNVFIANNRINKPDKSFKFQQNTSLGVNTIIFDYGDVNSIDVNKTYLNVTANKLNPEGGYWEKNVVIRDNWFYNHGRKGMDVSGHWGVIRNNHNERDYLQEGADIYGLGAGWELTLDGYKESGGSSDNESRAYDVAGKALWIDGNSWNNAGSNPGNDGESILCQAHGGTQIHSWAVTNNFYAPSYNEENKGYLSGYDVSNYGMLVAWNDTKGTVGNLNAKSGDHLIDCAFIASGVYETVKISGDHATMDAITSCPSGDLAPPVNLNVVAREDDSYILIEWEDASDQEIGFRVDRRLSGSDAWQTIAYRPRKSQGHPDNEQKWHDYLAVPGREYEYRVVAVNCDDLDEGASEVMDPVLLKIQVSDPWFSVESGEYEEAQEVEIHCAVEDAQIYYTTDGTEPDENDDLYTGPIMVDESVQIKAKAFLGENYPSETVTLDLSITTGITDDSVFDFKLSPNPAMSELYISVPEEKVEKYSLTIYDLAGRKLLEKKNLSSGREIISLSILDKGTYLIKLMSNSGNTGIKKLIKY